jgi:hypothetical protein
VRRAWTPEPVPADAKDEYRRRYRESNDPTDPTMPQAGRDRRRAEIEQLVIADTLPAFRTFVASTDGYLWVEPHAAAANVAPDSRDRDGPEPRLWSVFDPSGRWLGTIVTPGGFSIHEIGNDYVLGVWRNELDVSFVRLYRILKPGQ